MNQGQRSDAEVTARSRDFASDAWVVDQIDDPLLRDVVAQSISLRRDALECCRDLVSLLGGCGHEELAEVRVMLTAVRQLPGTPPGAQAVLRRGADLVKALDRALAPEDDEAPAGHV